MTKTTADTIKRHNIKCPEGWEILNNDEHELIKPTDQIWDFSEGCFYSHEYWIERDTNFSKEFGQKIIGSNMIIMRQLPVSKVYSPEKPEKLRVIRNIRSIVSRIKND